MSLAPTYLQELRANYPSYLDRDELRTTRFGLLNAALEMTSAPNSIVSPDVRRKAFDTSGGRALKIPVRHKGAVQITNARTCTVEGGRSQTELVNVTWKTVVANIVLNPAEYAINQINYMDDLAQKLREAGEALAIQVEQDIDIALDANKTQIFGSNIIPVMFPEVGDAIQVTGEDQMKRFWGNVTAINEADDFYSDRTKVLANTSLMPTISMWANQGEGNRVNLGWQFGDLDFTFSNRVSNDAGVFSTAYFMPNGSIGLLTRVDATAKQGHTAGDGTEWFTDRIPFLPFPVGIKYNSKCADISEEEESGLEEYTATIKESWQISFDYAIVTPFNSDAETKAGAIRKVEYVGFATSAPAVTAKTITETTGTPFVSEVVATNHPTSWAVVGTLPAGVTFEDGVFSGTPTATSSATVTVVATNNIGSGSATITFAITAP